MVLPRCVGNVPNDEMLRFQPQIRMSLFNQKVTRLLKDFHEHHTEWTVPDVIKKLEGPKEKKPRRKNHKREGAKLQQRKTDSLQKQRCRRRESDRKASPNLTVFRSSQARKRLFLEGGRREEME
jgi:hypothetical protein